MCTGVRFSDKEGHMYFGRNLDWCEGYGQYVVITPRGYKYQSAFLGEQAMKYAVIGMAIVEEDCPLYFDCMNEAGIGVAGLNFPGYTQYEEHEVEGKTNVAVYEFPMWVTMNFGTVEEVRKALEGTAIVDKALNEKTPSSKTHWMIGDGRESIVVEYGEDGMKVYDNSVDVLTNQPTYDWHRENLRNYMNLASPMPERVAWRGTEIRPFGTGSLMRGLPGDYYSPSRFVRAAYFNTHYPMKNGEEENVGRMFHILAGVGMIEGAAAMADGRFERTIYSSCYSSASRTYYYNTYENFDLRKVVMGDYELDGGELIKIK